MLETGTRAPEFSLPDHNGKMHSFADYRGRKVILYFYPADMSPRLQGSVSADTRKGAVVLGINADSVASHRKFMEEHGLPFTLLSDPDRTVLQAYDVWKERSMFGKPVMGIERSTYLIDEEGTIIRAFARVKPKDNARQMFREL